MLCIPKSPWPRRHRPSATKQLKGLFYRYEQLAITAFDRVKPTIRAGAVVLLIRKTSIQTALGGLVLAGIGWYFWTHGDLILTMREFNPRYLPLLGLVQLAMQCNSWMLIAVMKRFDVLLPSGEGFSLTTVHAMANHFPCRKRSGYQGRLSQTQVSFYKSFAASSLFCLSSPSRRRVDRFGRAEIRNRCSIVFGCCYG